MRGRAETVQQAEVGAFGGEMSFADGGPSIGQLEALADRGRYAILNRLDGGDRAVDQGPQDAGADLGDGFIDRGDAAYVESGRAFLVLTGEDFVLGMEHAELA